MHEVVLGHLVLDEAEDARRRADRRRDPEEIEVRLVARIVDACDHLGDGVLLLGDLGDYHVVLVIACQREHEVRRTLDPCLFEHVQLRRVALHHLVLELRLETLEAVALLFDERSLVPVAQKRAHDVRSRFAAACN